MNVKVIFSFTARLLLTYEVNYCLPLLVYSTSAWLYRLVGNDVERTPFKSTKSLQWTNIVDAILRKLCDERNARLFKCKDRSSKEILDLPIFHAFFLPLTVLSLNFLVANWRHLFNPLRALVYPFRLFRPNNEIVSYPIK